MLAAATFAAVRSAHQNARVTERALMAAIRPVLVPSRLTDPPEKVGFLDDHWIKVEAGRAVADVTDDAIYLTFGLRNVGSGLAVLELGLHRRPPARKRVARRPTGLSPPDPRPLHTRRRPGVLAGCVPRPRRADLQGSAGRHHRASTNGDRPLVRRSRGRPAHDHAVRAHPPRRRSVDHVRVAALDPRSTRSALTFRLQSVRSESTTGVSCTPITPPAL